MVRFTAKIGWVCLAPVLRYALRTGIDINSPHGFRGPYKPSSNGYIAAVDRRSRATLLEQFMKSPAALVSPGGPRANQRRRDSGPFRAGESPGTLPANKARRRRNPTSTSNLENNPPSQSHLDVPTPSVASPPNPSPIVLPFPALNSRPPCLISPPPRVPCCAPAPGSSCRPPVPPSPASSSAEEWPMRRPSRRPLTARSPARRPPRSPVSASTPPRAPRPRTRSSRTLWPEAWVWFPPSVPRRPCRVGFPSVRP